MLFVLNKDEIEECDEHGPRPQYQLGKHWGICDKCLRTLLRTMSFKVDGFKVRFTRINKAGNVELARAEH